MNVVGEGFALRNGKYKVERFEINSGVFNNPKGSLYHDERRRMHELSEHCVRKVVEYWKTAGPSWVRQRTFEVKKLLEDFDTTPFKKTVYEMDLEIQVKSGTSFNKQKTQ